MAGLVDQVTAVSPLHPFLTGSQHWVVGVSGGPDSLALLHLLRQLVGSERLVAAHLNHGLRPTATAEADFVAQTAAAWQIPFHQQNRDVTALARRQGLSLETAGRLARYTFLAAVARQVGTTLVAVGHQADDQAETVLLHLLRGSGLVGLRGMELVRPLPYAPDLLLLRPLLHIDRTEIEAYCQEHNLQPRYDASNQETSFVRNRLRHQLLPHLAGYNPQIKRQLRQMATIVAGELDLLNALTDEVWQTVVAGQGADWLALDRTGWQGLALALRRRVLRRAVEQLLPPGVAVGFRSLEQARLLAETEASGMVSVLPGNLQLEVGYEQLRLHRETAVLPLHTPLLTQTEPLPLPVPGRVELAHGWWVETAVWPDPDLTFIHANPDPWTVFIDGEQAGALWLRPRRPGERLQPLGLNGRSLKIKAIMINRKIAAGQRALWPLVANAAHPLWLVGHHLDERVRVTAATRLVWQLTCRRNSGNSESLLT